MGMGGRRIRKRKQGSVLAAGLGQVRYQTAELMLQHGLQALAANVVPGESVNAIADSHVISGNGFGDGACGFADVKEPAGYLLAGADFGECAKLAGVEIDF